MSMVPKKRSYRGHVQAEVRALTRQRVIEATMALYRERWIDDITLDDVAARAGVTVQTILRHFESKDGLVAAAGEHAAEGEVARRADVAPGDVEAAVRYIVGHYEEQGDLALRGLAQEARHSGVARIVDRGRTVHGDWVAHVFQSQLARLAPLDRSRRLAQLVAVLDVQTWQLLRRQAGLSQRETARAMRELLEGIVR